MFLILWLLAFLITSLCLIIWMNKESSKLSKKIGTESIYFKAKNFRACDFRSPIGNAELEKMRKRVNSKKNMF